MTNHSTILKYTSLQQAEHCTRHHGNLEPPHWYVRLLHYIMEQI